MLLRAFPLFILVFALLLPGLAHAQSEEDQAKALFRQGVEASDAGRWAEAVEAFTRSLSLVERPSTLFNLLTALREQARYREALPIGERYLVVAKAAEDAPKRAQVQRLITEMKDAMGTLVLRVEPAGAEVQVDDIAVPPRSFPQLYLSPGRHELVVRAEGYTPHQETITIERHIRSQVAVKLKRPEVPAVVAAPVPAPGPQPATKSQADRTRLDLQMKLLTMRRDLERAQEAYNNANRRKPLILAGLGVAGILAGSLVLTKGEGDGPVLGGIGTIAVSGVLLIMGGVSGLVRVGKRKHWSKRIDQLNADIGVTEQQLDFTINLGAGAQSAGLRLTF
jgi:tetratricopeptide (TPR) repeat protein